MSQTDNDIIVFDKMPPKKRSHTTTPRKRTRVSKHYGDMSGFYLSGIKPSTKKKRTKKIVAAVVEE